MVLSKRVNLHSVSIARGQWGNTHEKTETRTASMKIKHSRGEHFQKAYTWRGEAIRSSTAWMMTALSAAFGIQ